MNKSKPNQKIQKDELTGKWFHSFSKPSVVEWQGQILLRVNEDNYLVQLYEWVGGTPTIQKLVSLDEMKQWQFYDTTEEMKLWYTSHQRL